MTKWTEQQRAAIEARNPTLLISAAAGSGKTAVLIERIMDLLREGLSLDRMLIVTFTRAAAAEMRQRLHKRLCEEAANDARWAKQLDLLPQTQISTIHGFCQTVLRSDFQAAGIDPMSRICNEATGNTLFQQAMEEAMNDLCEKETPDFMLLMDSFSQQEIFDMCQQLEHFLLSLPHPFAWLEEKIAAIPLQGELEEHPWYQALLRQLPLEVEQLHTLWENQRELFSQPCAVFGYAPQLEADGFQLRTLHGLAGKELLNALAGLNFGRATAQRGLSEEEKAWKDVYFDLRKKMKDQAKKLCDNLSFSEEQTRMELCQVQRLVQGLAVMTQETHRRFQEKKRRRNLLDFSDLEQMTLGVLEQESVCEKLRREYDAVFVDECQDVSAIQDAILQKIHDEQNSLFMVGDVKQSIYRFRLADPTLFLGRMRTFSTEKDAAERRITLQMNFRSDANVLEATNDLFRTLMRREVTELDYLPEDELIPAPGRAEGAQVEMHLLNAAPMQADEESEIAFATSLEAEAARCAELIHQLHRQAEPIAYRDMVILMPKVRNLAERVAELLESQGIPVYCDMKGSYFDLPEIRAMLDLLRVLDNPLQDVPLLSTLKLPGFHLTDAELADIRLTDSGRNVPFYVAFTKTMAEDTPLGLRCRQVWEQLETWRFRLSTQSLSAFLWEVMQETGYYAAVGALSEGAARQANLRLLCQRITEYEQISDGSLQGFLQSAEELRASGESRSATLLGEEEDLVRIMTIHKSKGLEFPVVFVLGLEQRLFRNQNGYLHCHNELGVALPYVNKRLRIRRGTIADRAFVQRQREDELAERARLLYVAMTRAKQRLYLLGSTKDCERRLWFTPNSASRVWQGQSMLDWIMCMLMDDPALRKDYTEQLQLKKPLSTGHPQAANHWKIKVFDLYSSQPVEKRKVIHNILPQLEASVSGTSVDELGKRWEHMYEQPTFVPLKTSVSSLVRQMHEEQSAPDAPEEETAEDKRQPAGIVPLRMEELPPLPKFLQTETITGAHRGTVIHKALSLVNLDALRQSDKAEWSALLQQQRQSWLNQQLFTPEEAALLRVDDLTAFYRSDIGSRVLASTEVHREWSFNFRLSHDRQTLVQGVIDCAFREGDAWILLDYKTDRITDATVFVTQYAPQLHLYAQALQEITRLPVQALWLYSIQKQKSYKVEE